MGEVRVKQEDREAAASCVSSRKAKREIIDGVWDDSSTVQAFARHRQAAEKAQQERDAAYIEGKGGVIPGATVFVSLITGENMPCMSGDARDKLNPHKRRQFDDATRDLATAIRSQGHE
ncbi:hypothetical protein ACQKJZ_04580 [Sphingomonas sp. NPDC019816]|uniref:hypothetical protein n=1 Tax=Sphingomonas sp. NPDC019816 TaxID=3390679 RepID=UPI003D030D1A